MLDPLFESSYIVRQQAIRNISLWTHEYVCSYYCVYIIFNVPLREEMASLLPVCSLVVLANDKDRVAAVHCW